VNPNSACIAFAVASWRAELSSPTGRPPARATHDDTYPVPQPSSTTSAPATSAGIIGSSACGIAKIPQLGAAADQCRRAIEPPYVPARWSSQ
jgi:hypothetical protein